MINISKYVDFLLVEKTSNKTGKNYYAIVMRVKDKDYVLQFLTQTAYENLKLSLSD